MQLRDYQQALVDQQSDRAGDHTVTVAATGTGKGCLIAHELTKDIAEGRRSLVIVPSHSLKRNIEERLTGIDSNLVGDGRQVYIETYQSLVRKKLDSYDHCYIDEAHIAMCPSVQTILENNKFHQVRGYTATPRRLDGKPLSKTFKRLITTHNVRWFIDRGYLNDFELLTLSSSALRDELADSYSDRLSLQQELLSEKVELDNATELWKEHAYGRQTFFFCAGSEQGKELVETFSNAFSEFKFAYVDADTPKVKLDEIIAQFKNGIIKGIFNINLLILGIDVPNADCVFFLRFTYSLTVYLQIIGRVLRPSAQKSIILDPYGNCLEHGHPDISRDWSLEGKLKPARQEYCLCLGCKIPLIPQAVAKSLSDDNEYSCICNHCGDFNVFQFESLAVEQRRSRNSKKTKASIYLSQFGNDTPVEGITKILNGSRLPLQQKIGLVIKADLPREDKAKLFQLLGLNEHEINHHMLFCKKG